MAATSSASIQQEVICAHVKMASLSLRMGKPVYASVFHSFILVSWQAVVGSFAGWPFERKKKKKL